MFGIKTKETVVQAIDDLLRENMETIDEVHKKSGDLSIAIKVKLGAVGKNGTECLVQLEYIKEKIKTEARFQVDEKQMGLDLESDDITYFGKDRALN